MLENRLIVAMWAACGLVVAAVVVFIAYGIWFEVNDPGHGTITGKTHRPAFTTCSTVNKITTCTNHPECYEIRYTDGEHDGDACVTPIEYDRYRVGEQYPAAG